MTEPTANESAVAEKSPGETMAWERLLIEKAMLASVQESRRSRRWGIAFKLLTFLYLFVVLALLVSEDILKTARRGKDHTALVEIKGIIAPGAEAGADKVISGLREAFEDSHTKAVILRINSPGGSPVQAGYINDEVRRLKKKHQLPVYAVLVDVCASGGYYVAVAADKIYADRASLLGSIGVRMDGFGFVDTMKHLGVERRLLTAGERKGILDPFSPLQEQDRTYIQGILQELHQQFIGKVKEGRGAKLQEAPELFSGLFWSGETALKLGLIDGLGSSSYVARELVGAEEIVDFTRKDDLLSRLAERFGAGLTQSLGLGGIGESFPRY